MKIDNIILEYYIDYIGNKIHLLEKRSTSNYDSLVNNIGPEFQKRIIDSENLLIDVIDFEWLLYCSNDLVFTYKDYNLNIVSKTEKRLYGPFLSFLEGK